MRLSLLESYNLIKYAYLNEGIYVVGVATSLEYIPNEIWIDITDVTIPSSPPETWVLIDEVFTTDQVKLAQFNRQNMPNLSPIEFDIKLNNNGLYDAVQELIKDNFEMRIACSRAAFFSRTDSFVDQARIALNLTDEQVDEMWTS